MISAIATRQRLQTPVVFLLLPPSLDPSLVEDSGEEEPTLKTLMTTPSTQLISEKKISRVKFIRTVDPLEKETPQVLLQKWNEALVHI
jgi:hypothetical protein